MLRRAFLARTGTLAGGAVAVDQGVRRLRTTETITVAVYQTDRLTRQFEIADQDEDTGQRLAEEAVEDMLDSHFSPSFELEYGERTVPHRLAALPRELSRFSDESRTAKRSLVDWAAHDRQRSSVDSHVLLSYHDEIETGNGIASPAVLPSCCEPIDRYGIAWMATEKSDTASEYVRQTIAHEIGHTIGLGHSHGANVDDDRTLMLTSSHARRARRNRFGERIRPCGSRVSELNPRISESHLRV